MSRPARPSVVGEVMAVNPIVISANMPLDEAADLLDRHGISGAPVVDAAGSLVGVLSQTDLVRARSTEYLWANWSGLAVRHLMTTPAVTVERSTPIVIAAARMERQRIHRLVVVADDDKRLPIGVLTTADIVHVIAENARAASAKAAQPSDAPAGSSSNG